MLTDYLAHNIDELVNKIAEYGFCVIDNFINEADILALTHEITMLKDAEKMQVASTGRIHKAVNHQLRGDIIYWLDETNASNAQQAYFNRMEDLRLHLNQALYLGLFALESHLALYAAGASYKKHIDRFKNIDQVTKQPLRQISCILYLNQNWLAEHGGELRLYLNHDDNLKSTAFIDVLPVAGRLIVFLSDTFYHEVLPATRDRMSLTGWFLTR